MMDLEKAIKDNKTNINIIIVNQDKCIYIRAS